MHNNFNDLYVLLGFLGIYGFCFYIYFLTINLFYTVVTFVIFQLVYIYCMFYI